MQLKCLIIVMILMFCASHSFAVSPEMRLPEWHKTEFGIADWSPEQGLLVVKAAISAPLVDLHEVSCSLQHDFSTMPPEPARTHKIIKKGDKAVFMFRLNVKPECHGWLNFDLRARPDSKGLLEAIQIHANKPLSKAILASEIEKLEKAILLGQSIPVFVAEDIVVGVTREIALRPFAVDGNSFYVWLPEERFGTGIVAETFKALKKSASANQFRSAAAACSLIINKLKGQKAGLRAEPAHGEIFEIPNSVAVNLLELNHATFSALENSKHKRLQELTENMKSGYIKAFACFNLAMNKLKANKKPEGIALLKKAVELIPTWPKAQKLLEEIK